MLIVHLNKSSLIGVIATTKSLPELRALSPEALLPECYEDLPDCISACYLHQGDLTGLSGFRGILDLMG